MEQDIQKMKEAMMFQALKNLNKKHQEEMNLQETDQQNQSWRGMRRKKITN